jgi:membrane protein YqaA with SNARE-associated domain
MGRIVGRIRALAMALGAPGLFLVAFLDSTFLPLPGATDVMLIVTVTQHKEFVVWYVLAAMIGSIAGCLVMHAIGRKGGEALVRKRFTGEKTERAMTSLQRHGVMAVLIPSILPPPAPFKIFVLLAGVVGISATRCAIAIAIGRGVRYATLGFLAVTYGSRATAFVRQNGTAASLAAVGVLMAGFAASLVWTRVRRRKKPLK